MAAEARGQDEEARRRLDPEVFREEVRFLGRRRSRYRGPPEVERERREEGFVPVRCHRLARRYRKPLAIDQWIATSTRGASRRACRRGARRNCRRPSPGAG